MRDRRSLTHRWVWSCAVFALILAVLLFLPGPQAALCRTDRLRSAPEPADPYRPIYHFSPPTNFMNDPNGLIYHRGVYHLFFQYNPRGNTSWGHATSTDLVHWQDQPLAIPADPSEQVWSGSVVFDRTNSSGLGTRRHPPLVAAYTSFHNGDGRQRQSLAYSTDHGTTWTKYAHNPVIDIGSKDFRDPKMFWDAERERWVMVVALAAEKKTSIYTSTNLTTWTHRSNFGPAGAANAVWECPDLFPLTLHGKQKWVLTLSVAGRTQYFVGDFDGSTYTTAPGSGRRVRWVDHGNDYYAAVSFNDVPSQQRLMLGWMSNWDYAQATPTGTWRGQQSIARQLSLTTDDGTASGQPTLVQQPVGLDAIKGPTTRFQPMTVSGYRRLDVTGSALRITATLVPRRARHYGFDVRVGPGQRTRIGYDHAAGELYVDRTRSGDTSFHSGFAGVQRAPLTLHDRPLHLDILVDSSSVEVFADHGRVAISDLIYPDPSSRQISIFTDRSTVRVQQMTTTSLHRSVPPGRRQPESPSSGRREAPPCTRPLATG